MKINSKRIFVKKLFKVNKFLKDNINATQIVTITKRFINYTKTLKKDS